MVLIFLAIDQNLHFFKIFVTEQERKAINDEVARIRIWLEDEVGITTSTEEFIKKRRTLDNLLKPIDYRIKQEKVFHFFWFF